MRPTLASSAICGQHSRRSVRLERRNTLDQRRDAGQPVGAGGSYYLHIRSYNNDTTKVTSGNVLTLGPYSVDHRNSDRQDQRPVAIGQRLDLLLAYGKTVTGVVGNAFWIEETDRSAAIKVLFTGTAPVRGHKVTVIGQSNRV